MAGADHNTAWKASQRHIAMKPQFCEKEYIMDFEGKKNVKSRNQATKDSVTSWGAI